jgi:hypothetical protein
VTQICANGGGKATARDRRKNIIAQITLFIHKKSYKIKISEIFFLFFSTLNQYFPHISYVASKNDFSRWRKISKWLTLFFNILYFRQF